MATIAHTIYSHYDPQQRESLEYETGQFQIEEAKDSEDLAWQAPSQRRAQAPLFVPATIAYDEWGGARSSQSVDARQAVHPRSDLAGWYKSLTSRGVESDVGGQSATPDSSSNDTTLPQNKIQRKREKCNRNNWFIMNALQSAPTCTSPIAPPTMADILARDPPPLTTEAKYYPPVWLTLGPSNKGFTMLQQSGWNEGEPLGPSVVRRGKATHVIPDNEKMVLRKELRAKGPFMVKQEERQVQWGSSGEVTEVQQVDVIDLTLSDSDSDSDESQDSSPNLHEVRPDVTAIASRSPQPRDGEPISPHSQKALLTPIATVLKSDRLGIGLKAKTVGPYKVSQKRVTHNTAALAVHLRNAEEQRRKKAEVGRGHRGFEKMKRTEETRRKQMLAYLNE